MIGQIKQESELPRQKKSLDVHAVSRRSLWEILLFILISVGAFQLREFDLLASVSEPVRELLGHPPPAYLVSIALAVYCFSALTIALIQIANHAEPTLHWSHLGYRSMFYLFYSVSGSLANNFMAVFFIGFFLYAIEQAHVWIYAHYLELQEEELLGQR